MAKLSARGRIEIVRVVKEWETDECHERTTLAFMSDGNVLKKRQWKRKNPSSAWEAGWQTTNWTVRMKLPDNSQETINKSANYLVKQKGWKRV